MPSYRFFLKARFIQDSKMAALKFTGIIFLLLLAVINNAHAGKRKKCCQRVETKIDALTSMVENLDCQGTTHALFSDFSLGFVELTPL